MTAGTLHFGPVCGNSDRRFVLEQVVDIQGMALDDALARAVEGIYGEPEQERHQDPHGLGDALPDRTLRRR
jgi:hypothetical protein